ncbi:MAG: 3-demethylubiquinone-9 3-methyltransferase [Gemmatimonadetes bacterium]|nr:3-demethylubiquinone-9 3-methyltransferase [Gemmatimonadota bacterium]
MSRDPHTPARSQLSAGASPTQIHAMKIFTYLNYGGNCRQAFEFYAEHLGGKITMMQTHGDVPDPSQVPAGWKDAILHARIEIGGTVIFGADTPPERFQPMRSAYLSLLLDSNEQAEQVYALLTDGGEIFMKMEETFFAHRFAMLRDRFGTSWMLLHERPM